MLRCSFLQIPLFHQFKVKCYVDSTLIQPIFPAGKNLWVGTFCEKKMQIMIKFTEICLWILMSPSEMAVNGRKNALKVSTCHMLHVQQVASTPLPKPAPSPISTPPVLSLPLHNNQRQSCPPEIAAIPTPFEMPNAYMMMHIRYKRCSYPSTRSVFICSFLAGDYLTRSRIFLTFYK